MEPRPNPPATGSYPQDDRGSRQDKNADGTGENPQSAIARDDPASAQKNPASAQNTPASAHNTKDRAPSKRRRRRKKKHGPNHGSNHAPNYAPNHSDGRAIDPSAGHAGRNAGHNAGQLAGEQTTGAQTNGKHTHEKHPYEKRAAKPNPDPHGDKSAPHRSAQQTPKKPASSSQQRPYEGAKRAHFNANQPLYAALDLGTNNCRLLIAKPTRAGQFYVVDAFSRIVRLGEGLAKHGTLSQGAMDRATEALKICAAKLDRQPIKKYRLIATEACRQASNGSQFLQRVKKETGLDLEIINRETEARLAVSGCASLVGQHTNSVILFDIGGGSSEIALVQFQGKRSPRLANHIAAWTSLPVGVVTLSERHGGQEVTQDIFDEMVAEVDQLIAKTAPQQLLSFEPDRQNFHLLGTSGTVTTLAGLHLDLPRYDRRQVDGLWMKDADVDQMLQKLLSWDIDKRSANPCIGPDRSDLVLAGCAIMQAIRKRWPSNRMRVADRGLREGLLNDMMARDGVWRRRKRNGKPKAQRKSHNRSRPNAKTQSANAQEPKGHQE